MAIVTPALSSVAAVSGWVSRVPHSGDELAGRVVMACSKRARATAVATATLTVVTLRMGRRALRMGGRALCARGVLLNLRLRIMAPSASYPPCEMIATLRGFRMREGHRGAPAVQSDEAGAEGWPGTALALVLVMEVVLLMALVLVMAPGRAGVGREPAQAQAYGGRHQPERDPAQRTVVHERVAQPESEADDRADRVRELQQ